MSQKEDKTTPKKENSESKNASAKKDAADPEKDIEPAKKI